MKKISKLIILGITFFLFTMKVNATPTLDEIENAFINHPAIKSKKEIISTDIEGDKLIIRIKDVNTYELNYILDENILSMYHRSSNYLEQSVVLTYSAYLVDSIGTLNGYKYGDLFLNFNSLDSASYSIDEDGLEIIARPTLADIQIDLTKKIPLLHQNDTYIQIDDLEEVKEKISGKGEVNLQKGNILFIKNDNDKETTLIIVEQGLLTENSYKSLLSIIETMFPGTNVIDYFKKNYDASFTDKKFAGFNIEINPIKNDYEEFLMPSGLGKSCGINILITPDSLEPDALSDDDDDLDGYSVGDLDNICRFMRITINKDEAIKASNPEEPEKIEEIENPKTGIISYVVFGSIIIMVTLITIIILNKNNQFTRL